MQGPRDDIRLSQANGWIGVVMSKGSALVGDAHDLDRDRRNPFHDDTHNARVRGGTRVTTRPVLEVDYQLTIDMHAFGMSASRTERKNAERHDNDMKLATRGQWTSD